MSDLRLLVGQGCEIEREFHQGLSVDGSVKQSSG